MGRFHRVVPPPIHPSAAFDVLVADDDAAIRELLTEFFAMRGMAVASVADGRAGVAALERSEGRYQLVMTDINMPGADGFAVLNAARAANPSSYVVMITGFATLDGAIQAVRNGAQDYLTKPFLLGQIDVILRQATARFALERENRQLTARGAGSTAGFEKRLTAIEESLSQIHSLITRLSR